ncbi:MAG: PHP domain-containing protein [bacterium]
MLEVDLHAHSLFSGCGLHTVLEMLGAARERGMKALAITDHGPALGGRISSVFFDRLQQPMPGIRLLKGMECNVLLGPGEIDCPMQFLPRMDILLLGLHLGEHSNQPRKFCTDLLVHAIQANPFVDIITHPNSTMFPVEYERLAAVAVEHGVALELNNSKDELSQVPREETCALVAACLKTGCRMAVNSDAHTLQEIGNDNAVRSYLESVRFPQELIVNATAEAAFEFIEQRRELKKSIRHQGQLPRQ